MIRAIFASIFLFVLPSLSFGADRPIKVFILAGQSNMEGKAKVSLLEYQIAQPATRDLFVHWQKDGKWIERSDVRIKFLDRAGPLTIGYGSPKCIGPELEFGNVVGNHYEEPVLLIKPAWGGRSLYRDFRSPSAGLPKDEALQKMLAEMQKKKPDATLDDVKAPFGFAYRDMLKEIRETLSDIKSQFPGETDLKYELCGIAWFQGWNDLINADYTAEYTANLQHFIRDVRKDLGAPNLPFVIAQEGVDGVNANAGMQKFKAAQAAVLDADEFKGNVAVVKTDVFWDTAAEAVFKKGWRENIDEWNKVGSDYPFHYLGSCRTMKDIGGALGKAMIELQPKK